MARIRYTGANGEEPPLSELEREKLKGQRLANEISQTRLKRLRGEVKETHEVKFVYDTTLLVIQQAMRRWPSLVVRVPELRALSHEQIFAIRMSLDKSCVKSLIRLPTPSKGLCVVRGTSSLRWSARSRSPPRRSSTLRPGRRLGPTRSAARKGKANNKHMDNIDNDIAVHLDAAALRKLIRRVRREQDRDDANDVRWWKSAFEVLKPPKKPPKGQLTL
jgi:hypothetical protein